MPLSQHDLSAINAWYGLKSTSIPSSRYTSWEYTGAEGSILEKTQVLEKRIKRERDLMSSFTLTPGIYSTGGRSFFLYPPRSRMFIVHKPFSLAIENWYDLTLFSPWGGFVQEIGSAEKSHIRDFLRHVVIKDCLYLFSVDPVPDLKEML